MKVVQSCPTLCDPMNHTVHEILQARILEWVAVPFLQGIFQILNPGLLHCRQILYCLSQIIIILCFSYHITLEAQNVWLPPC